MYMYTEVYSGVLKKRIFNCFFLSGFFSKLFLILFKFVGVFFVFFKNNNKKSM